jgi:hypothetical protein
LFNFAACTFVPQKQSDTRNKYVAITRRGAPRAIILDVLLLEGAGHQAQRPE